MRCRESHERRKEAECTGMRISRVVCSRVRRGVAGRAGVQMKGSRFQHDTAE